MSKIIKGRMTAVHEGDFVVFIIGMRLNNIFKVHKWLPAIFAMPAMLKELAKNPESGFLGAEQGMRFMIQYWRSLDDLTRYARATDSKHFPAWVRFNKALSKSTDLGIFHETFIVKAGAYECVYNNMPPFGLGKVSKLVPAKGKYGSARSRAGLTETDDAPVDAEGNVRAVA